jgi:hypothetical protein
MVTIKFVAMLLHFRCVEEHHFVHLEIFDLSSVGFLEMKSSSYSHCYHLIQLWQNKLCHGREECHVHVHLIIHYGYLALDTA